LPSPELRLEPSDPVVPVVEVRDDRLVLVPAVLEVWSLDNVPLVAPLEPSEITAKSTLPEPGLMMTSLMVPSVELPAEPFTCDPTSLVAQTSWLPERPVALNEPDLLQSLWLPEIADELLDESVDCPLDNPLEELCFDPVEGLSVEFWACAAATMPARQIAVRAIELFFIFHFLLLTSFVDKTHAYSASS
jgi:hypothetical protein